MTMTEALKDYHPGHRLMVEWPLFNEITRKVCVSIWPEYARAPMPPDTLAEASEGLPGLETEQFEALRLGNGWSIEKLGKEEAS